MALIRHNSPIEPTNCNDELVAITLQLEEVMVHSNGGKGKHPIDSSPSSNAAFHSFQVELETLQTTLNDQKIARSLASAVRTDCTTIAQLAAEELRCHQDRLLALRTSMDDRGYERPPASALAAANVNVQDWVRITSEAQRTVSSISTTDNELEAGPSRTHLKRKADEPDERSSKKLQCTVCLEPVFVDLMITLPCNDRYCIDCLKRLFVRVTKDETLFPARCCKQQIPLQLISPHMSSEELKAFRKASIEWTTAKRIYCSNLYCAEFIPPAQIESSTSKASCNDCGTSTCGICRKAFHQGKDCPEDPDLEKTRELARQMGWQNCSGCGRYVEVNIGCNHMTCPCGAQFCYQCGSRWKTCRCPQWQENMLMERAREVVDRNAGRDLDLLERARRVAAMRVELEEDHECEHDGDFNMLSNPPEEGYECELCEDTLYGYILECAQCHITVCLRCQRNRL